MHFQNFVRGPGQACRCPLEFGHFFAPEARGRLAGGERSGTTGIDRKGSRVPAGRRTEVRNSGATLLQRPSLALRQAVVPLGREVS